MIVDADKVKERLAKACEDEWKNADNAAPVYRQTMISHGCLACIRVIRQADLSDCAVESQAAEIARLKEDAGRYQHLRLQKENLAICFGDYPGRGSFGLWDICDALSGKELDTAIDSAKGKS